MTRTVLLPLLAVALLLPGCRLFANPANAGRRENYDDVQRELRTERTCAACGAARDAVADDAPCPACGAAVTPR